MKAYRMYLKDLTDGVGISVYADSFTIDNELEMFCFLNEHGSIICLIALERLEKVIINLCTDQEEVIFNSTPV